MYKNFRIYLTDEEYIEQGFTTEECPKIREFDILNYNYNELTESQLERYESLIKELGL